jgi:molybdenum-dependent DNA-binding transcriptional regulator ModE
MSTRRSSYTPMPSVPQEQLPRLAAIVEVLAGLKSVSEAARSLGLSRNHFQTILHRAVLTLAESLTPRKSGRPARADTALAVQLKRLQRENARLQRQVDATERLLEVAGG